MIEQATEVNDLAETVDFDTDQQLIWAEQKAMYAAFLADDRDRIDRWIDPTATIWDAVHEPIANGLDDLNRIRAGRPQGTDRPVVTAMTVNSPIISVYGDTAIGRHVLHVESASATRRDARTSEVVRVSSAWRRVADRWWLVHSHEDIYSTRAP